MCVRPFCAVRLTAGPETRQFRAHYAFELLL